MVALKVQVQKVEDSSVANMEDGILKVTETQAQAYYDAADELYDMYVEAVDYIIDNDLFFDVGVPFNLVEAIKKSWENDVHWHIFGRFLFSGGLDAEPLIVQGFDADAPHYLVETALEQYDLLKAKGIDTEEQYNEVYEKISDNFKRLITLMDDTELFEERYNGWKILFSSLAENKADERAVRFLQQMADDAGFETEFEYLQNVHFGEDGIGLNDEEEFEYWYKQFKWSEMAHDEPELLVTLTNIMKNQKAIILNPAYTAVFESQGILKILRQLYPNSPYLSDKEADNSKPQAHVIFAYEACGLGFVQDDTFIAHSLV